MTAYRLNGVSLELPESLQGTRIEQKLADGDYEGDEAHAVLRRVKPGMKVLEVGAGLGYVTTLCAQASGAENVMSVEANPEMLEPIKKTLQLNDVAEVTLAHGALVGDDHADDVVNFHAGPLFWGGAVVPNGETRKQMLSVPALRLSGLLKAQRPRFVMLDVEGGEGALFEAKWPRFVRFVVLELHPKKYPHTTIKKIVDCMSASGLTYDPVTSRGRTLGFMRVSQTDG